MPILKLHCDPETGEPVKKVVKGKEKIIEEKDRYVAVKVHSGKIGEKEGR